VSSQVVLAVLASVCVRVTLGLLVWKGWIKCPCRFKNSLSRFSLGNIVLVGLVLLAGACI
jgi:hypothetical protein